MIIRKFIIVWMAVEYLWANYLSRDGHPVASMVIPSQIYVKSFADTMRCVYGELVSVVVSCRIPVMPDFLEISFCPGQCIVSRDICPVSIPGYFHFCAIWASYTVRQFTLPRPDIRINTADPQYSYRLLILFQYPSTFRVILCGNVIWKPPAICRDLEGRIRSVDGSQLDIGMSR